MSGTWQGGLSQTRKSHAMFHILSPCTEPGCIKTAGVGSTPRLEGIKERSAASHTSKLWLAEQKDHLASLDYAFAACVQCVWWEEWIPLCQSYAAQQEAKVTSIIIRRCRRDLFLRWDHATHIYIQCTRGNTFFRLPLIAFFSPPLVLNSNICCFTINKAEFLLSLKGCFKWRVSTV